jgi:hypothetical protein
VRFEGVFGCVIEVLVFGWENMNWFNDDRVMW